MIIGDTKSITDAELERFVIYAKACKGFDVYDRLTEISAPLFVIGSHGDKVTTGKASLEIAEKTGCDIYMYAENYGHAVYDEAADYKKLMLSFFDKIW